jgi:tRNA nucleotidyltransferase (CCA-adding enzyme)
MPDYNFLMESRLRPGQLQVVNQLGRLAAGQGLNLYLAGGAVRDLTLGREGPRDLDFVVEGNIERILRPLTSGARRQGAARPGLPGDGETFDLQVESLRSDSRRHVAEALFEGGVQAEIAATRNEVYSTPGRPPVISRGTIFEDLKRRDFSVNAMAISLHPNSRGLLLDPTNGAADIERHELRALHSRSFFDDPVRIYRVLRLGLRLGFKLDERTLRWLERALESRAWEDLNENQQGRELSAILQEEQCGRLLKALRERGLLGGLDRTLASARLDLERFDRIRTAHRIAADADPYLLNFEALVAKVPGGQRTRLARKILGEARTVKFALTLEREAAKLARQLGSARVAQPSQVYTLLAAQPRPLVLFLLAHYPQVKIQTRVRNFLVKAPSIRARLPRAELQALGVEPGPKFEKVLDQVFRDQLDGKLKTPPQVTKALHDYAGIKPPPPAAKPKAKPKAAKPGAVKPEAAQPTTAKPPTVKPAVAKPGIAQPKVAEPQAAPTKAAKAPLKPAAVKPAVAKPGTAQPKVVKPLAAPKKAAKAPAKPKPRAVKPRVKQRPARPTLRATAPTSKARPKPGTKPRRGR